MTVRSQIENELERLQKLLRTRHTTSGIPREDWSSTLGRFADFVEQQKSQARKLGWETLLGEDFKLGEDPASKIKDDVIAIQQAEELIEKLVQFPKVQAGRPV